MIAPAWFLMLIIVGVLSAIALTILNTFIAPDKLQYFFEEWMFPAIVLGMLAILATCAQ